MIINVNIKDFESLKMSLLLILWIYCFFKQFIAPIVDFS
jgi:hypothetical protein